MIFFLCLFATCMLIQITMTFPYLSTVQIAINLTCSIICTVFLFLSSFKQPGYLKPQTTDFIRLLATIDSTSLCADCCTIRTSRSRHCSICGHCVERFDHHCPWVNNCVGVGNHMPFYFFIVSMFLTLLVDFLQGFYILVQSFNYGLIPSPFGVGLGYEPRESLLDPLVILLIIITGFFLLPVAFLIYV